MYVFDMETGDAYSVDFAHLQTYLQQLLIDRANCDNAYLRSVCYSILAFLSHCNDPYVHECEDMLHVVFAYEHPIDHVTSKQILRFLYQMYQHKS